MKIIIVGAGIGGLSAALALSLQGHHDVLILESAPQLAEIGAGVQLTPDAIKFFFRWGMRDDILAKAAMPGKFVIHQEQGPVLREIDIRALEDDYAAPYVVVHRGVLHEILHRHAVRAGAEVRVNARVVDYDFEGGSVVLKSGETLTAGLVVACDGINSSARRQFLGQDQDRGPQKTGWAAYRMLADVSRIRAADPTTADLVARQNNHLWIGDGRSAMTYMIYESTVLNMVMSHRDDVDTTSWTPDEYMREVKSLFKGWDPRLTTLIDLARPTIQNWPVYQVEPLPRWTSKSGKFVIMGDAAHAMAFYLSMGISLAVEDAVALAEVLSLLEKHSANDVASSDSNPQPTLPQALALFESQRKPRAEAIQRASLRAGNVLHLPSGRAQRMRDASMAADGSVLEDGAEQKGHEGDERREAEAEDERSFVYGIADRRTRDWCYGFDAAEEVRGEWDKWFGSGQGR